jgi:CubicO group peptidase (beta-lactamase class C family)
MMMVNKLIVAAAAVLLLLAATADDVSASTLRNNDGMVNSIIKQFGIVGMDAWSVSGAYNDQQSSSRSSSSTTAAAAATFCTQGSGGYRINSTTTPSPRVSFASRWHIGSNTKSMTAVLMATLIAQGANGTAALGWRITLQTVLPALATGTPYAAVTLAELAGMLAGFAPGPPGDGFWRYAESGKPIMQQRAECARDAFSSAPVARPGTTFVYSNWGFVVLGYIVESITGRSWESQIAERLFAPLGIADVTLANSFGPPRGEPATEPWGHTGGGGGNHAYVACDPYTTVCDNPRVMGPAGTFSGSTHAMAAYVAWHVRCHNGKDSSGILPQAACAALHAPANSSVSDYGFGLDCVHRAWANGVACMHTGSNTLWMHQFWLAPGINRAFVSSSNGGAEGDSAAMDAAITYMIEQQAAC